MSIQNYSSPVQFGSVDDWKQISIANGDTGSPSISHVLGIKSDYTLWGWGRNGYGRIYGNPFDNSVYNSPIQIGSYGFDWKYVATGGRHSYAINQYNQLYTWGENVHGALGLGDTISRSSPVQVSVQQVWAKIDGGVRHSIAIKTDGTAWAWGDNFYGQLGDLTRTDRSSPVQIGTDTWRDIQCGSFSNIAIKSDGTLWSWGRGNEGQLGDGTSPTYQSSPVQIGTDSDWKSISMTQYHWLAIKYDGSLWACGRNSNGELGSSDLVNRSSPIQIGSDTDWKLAKASFVSSLFMKTNGTIYSTGTNTYGSLGYGENSLSTSSPVQIGGEVSWKTIDIGGNASVFSQKYVEQGGVFTVGQNSFGELGIGVAGGGEWRSSPIQVGINTTWKDVSINHHGLIVKSNGTLWAWGTNTWGQLGQGDSGTGTERSSPVQVGTLRAWSKVEAGSAGGTSAAIRADGTLWLWGNNSSNFIQSGGSLHESSPVQKGSDTDWAEVKMGSQHMGGLKTDGSLYLWGNAGQGQLGNLSYGGTTTTPYQVDGTWSKFAVGNNTSLGIKSDGTLWTWGVNTNGINAQGDTGSARSSPTQVGVLTDWYDIACNGLHAIAVKTDGTLWSWGRNNFGALGQEDIVDRSSPVQVGTDTHWERVATSYNSSYAIRKDGTAWAWGLGNYGQLGQNNTTSYSSPVQIGSEQFYKIDSDVITSSSGIAIFLRKAPPLDDSGTLYFAGENTFGQAGVGTTYAEIQSYSYPTQVGVDNTPWSDGLTGNSGLSMGIKEDKSLWFWGRGTSGAFGDGVSTTQDRSFPVQMGTDNVWTRCWTQGNNSGANFAMRDDNSIWAWGLGTSGQLGQGDAEYRSSPVQIGSETDWIEMDAGVQGHVLGVREGGDLYVWGNNQFGQLGQGDTANVSSPVQLGASGIWSENINGISASQSSIFAIKKDGTLWACGRNSYGDLAQGDSGSGTDRSSPVQIGSDTDWLYVAGGAISNCFAIKTDGTLWSWGNNQFGQLGQGDTTNRSSPVQVGTETDWIYIEGAAVSTYGIRSDGTLWSWGRNIWGQLGIGNRTSYSSPIQVGTATGWIKARSRGNSASNVMLIGV